MPLGIVWFAAAVLAQEAPAKLDRVIGEVSAIDAAAKQLTVKTDAGTAVAAVLDEKAVYLRIPPGEKDLKKAARITLEQVNTGDRVYVRGRMSPDQKSITALAVIIMTKAELAQKHERDREEWKRRGVAGPVTAINPETKEITISTRAREGAKPVVIEVAEHVSYRRYTPDSVRFSDAKSSSFSELKVGDQLRALGDKNADGTRLKAEEIVSGSFRNIAGEIRSIDAGAGEIKLVDLVTHKPVVVHVTSDTALRRLPPWMAAMLARRGGPGGAEGGAPGGSRPEGARPAPVNAAAGTAEQGPGGGGMRRGGMDFQDMLERMPALKLDELKQGEAIMLSATSGTDTSRATAINLLAGVEPLLRAAPEGGQDIFGSWNFDIGLPQ